jgi:integrase
MRVVKQSNGVYAVAFKDPNVTGRGKNPWRTISLRTSDEREAQANLQEWLAEQNREKAKHHTIGDLWELYLPTIQGRPSLRTRLAHWKVLSSSFGTISGRTASGVSPGTIRSELKFLRRLLNWSYAKGHLTERPIHFDLPQAPMPREDYLLREQFTKVLAEAEYRHVRLFLILAITTAARMGAILDLTWDRVDFERRRINLRNPVFTTRKGRAIVPMNDSAYAALLEAKEHATTPYVIEWGGQRVLSVHKGVVAAAARAGYPWVTAHVLRHTAAVWMVESGVPMSEVAQYLGHSSTRVTEAVYGRYSPTYLMKAASALEI